jgi:hypothetical protein
MRSTNCPHCGKVNVVQMTPGTVAASCKFCGKALYNRGDNTNGTPAVDDRIGPAVHMTDDQRRRADDLLASCNITLTGPT